MDIGRSQIRRILKTIPILIYFLTPYSAYSQLNCDGISTPEKVRIYYVNGMDNEPADMNAARRFLQNTVRDTRNNVYRLSVNVKEPKSEEVLQVLRQRLGAVDPTEFWTWWNQPTANTTPTSFKEALANEIHSASSVEYSRDADLTAMVDAYLGDLNAGKKVVLVSHSQGNFYANNAYAYITARYPNYQNSIGVVSVATPASFVAGNGSVTQNSRDRVIFGVVSPFFNVVAANVAITGTDLPNHGFIRTYMFRKGTKIVSDIRNTIARLEQPEISPECDSRIAAITTLNAKDVTDKTAKLEGRLTNGQSVDVWFDYDDDASKVICDDSNVNGIGIHTAVKEVGKSISNLKANTLYYARACAKGAIGGYDDGGLVQFITDRGRAEVVNLGAENVGGTSAQLKALLTTGINVDVWFRWATLGQPLSCNGNNYDGIGNFTAETTVLKTVSGLNTGTKYKYIACAKGGDGVTNESAESTFETTIPSRQCGNQVFKGGSAGVQIVFDFGTQKGDANIIFEAFEIPDKLDIYKHGTQSLIASTPGFVSGTNTGSMPVDGSFSKADVFVTGNTDIGTKWELTILCPN